MSPLSGSFIGKRKAVTFSNDEPDVVTVTRQIKAERLQKIKEEHARGEEAMFDLDDAEDMPVTKPESTQEQQIGPSPAKKPRRIIKGFEDDGESVKLSFPVNGAKKMEYTMARSLPNTSILASSSLGLKMPASVRGSDASVSSLEAPYVGELRKMMAAQTPTHRGAWKAGSFDPRAQKSDEGDNGDESNEDDTMEEDVDETTSAMEGRPATSAPIPFTIRAAVRVSADNDFEGAMSKSMDPGPVLELLTDQRYRSAKEMEEEEEDREADREAQDQMQKLIEGRGSLHAQRILSHQNRGVPASMWRSMA